MVSIFGNSYRLDTLISYVLFFLSIGIISLNLLYKLKFGTDIISINMGIGVVLLVYSSYNLFFKKAEYL